MSDIEAKVATLYDTYPFPPEPLLNEPPPGYNWRWQWQTAYSFCAGLKPPAQPIRILDAGCGSGVSTEYLVHLNPEATVVGIDVSAGALAVAQERCHRSGATRVSFQHLSLFDVSELPGTFDLINSVGVLHHTPDPERGIQALAAKLAPGGLFHIFVYGALGRWEIMLMQEAIGILQQERRGDYQDGVQVGRQLFAALPEGNCLKEREKQRWAWENQQDANFADMYVHPHEIRFTIPTLQKLIAASGLRFLGFSNPGVWQLERLIGANPALLDRAAHLSEWERYRLIELLDPHAITHYEFFLGKDPLPQQTWESDADLLIAIPEVSPCLQGWRESPQFFNQDYQVVQLEEVSWRFLLACEGNQDRTVQDILATIDGNLGLVRSLQRQHLILLAEGKE